MNTAEIRLPDHEKLIQNTKSLGIKKINTKLYIFTGNNKKLKTILATYDSMKKSNHLVHNGPKYIIKLQTASIQPA
jgi:hypothetical protein